MVYKTVRKITTITVSRITTGGRRNGKSRLCRQRSAGNCVVDNNMIRKLLCWELQYPKSEFVREKTSNCVGNNNSFRLEIPKNGGIFLSIVLRITTKNGNCALDNNPKHRNIFFLPPQLCCNLQHSGRKSSPRTEAGGGIKPTVLGEKRIKITIC